MVIDVYGSLYTLGAANMLPTDRKQKGFEGKVGHRKSCLPYDWLKTQSRLERMISHRSRQPRRLKPYDCIVALQRPRRFNDKKVHTAIFFKLDSKFLKLASTDQQSL